MSHNEYMGALKNLNKYFVMLIILLTLIAVVAVRKQTSSVNVNVTAQERADVKFKNFDRSVTIGTRNDSVILLQKRLKRFGYATKNITGIYDKKTIKSVKKVQQDLGVKPTGKVTKKVAKFLKLRLVTPLIATPANIGNVLKSPLSNVELKTVLAGAGFKEENLVTAWAIAMRESRGVFDIVSKPNSDGTRDWGLFQFNDIWRNKYDFNRMLDPYYNASVAWNVSGNGTDFSAWAVGDIGWAGYLKRNYPGTRQKLNNELNNWKTKFPYS